MYICLIVFPIDDVPHLNVILPLYLFIKIIELIWSSLLMSNNDNYNISHAPFVPTIEVWFRQNVNEVRDEILHKLHKRITSLKMTIGMTKTNNILNKQYSKMW
jgi:hypothetical protein